MKSVLKRGKLLGVLAVGAMLWACSDDKSVAGGTTDDAGIVAVKDLNVAGVTQKGPFAKGSKVTVQGIDCKTMKLTDEIFEGEVKSDKGDFAVEGVTLKSTCAVLEVTGRYLNELSGKKSSEEITLRVLTDLENRKTVNVNVLTELEYGRAVYLVTEKKKPVADAKKRAGKEVLAAFGIEGDFGSSEDLTIFEGGDGNAALLAVSVLMQAETDEAGLTKRMDKFADSFAETGKWNDDETKAAIDGWRVSATADGTLDSIRKSVDGWEYADEVPPFEKYIEVFGDSVVLPDDEDVDEGSSSSGKGKSSGDSANSSSSGKGKSGDNSVKSSSSSGAKTQSSGKDSSATTSSSSKDKSSAESKSLSSSGKGKSGDESVKSSSSSGSKTPSSGKDSSATTSSSGEGESSSSSAVPPGTVVLATPCKTDSTDTCEYGTLTDDRDGQTYKTVKIGNQEWMAENLNYAYTDVPYELVDYTSDSTSWCFGNDASNCTKYGRSYTWAAAMDSLGKWSTNGKGCGYDITCTITTPVRGICPGGWHLPSKTEWETLFTAVGGQPTAGKVLKSTSGWGGESFYGYINGNGTDAFGFSALPASGRRFTGHFGSAGLVTHFWSSTEDDSEGAYHMVLLYNDEEAYVHAYALIYEEELDNNSKIEGKSVRCVKD